MEESLLLQVIIKSVNKSHKIEHNILAFVGRWLFWGQILYKPWPLFIDMSVRLAFVCSHAGLYSDVTANTDLDGIYI